MAQKADWYPDPTQRHQHRYWNGTAWTDNVADNGQSATDTFNNNGPARPEGDLDATDDGGGRGQFGDGISAPLYEFRASRLKGGRAFTPNVIRVWPDRIEEYEHHVVRKKGTQGINFTQVAQVRVSRGLMWSDLAVESTGGHLIQIVGMPKAESERVKSLLDDAIHRAKGPASATSATPTAAAPIDVADQLGKLAALRDQGVLTEEEFQAQKAKVLG